MKKCFMILVLMAVVFCGCTTIDYFTNANNQKALVDLGLNCFAGNDVKIGAVYVIKKDGLNVSPTTTGEFVIGCGDKLYTVVCDVTKKPEENPCSNVREYLLKTDATKVPVSWLETGKTNFHDANKVN